MMKTHATKQIRRPSNNHDDDDPKHYNDSFPGKLFALLEDAEEDGNQEIVSWIDDGNGFCIHKRDDFCEKLMNLYFKQTKFTSFTRQVCDDHHEDDSGFSLYLCCDISKKQHLISSL
jgi:hypothetical protein